MENRVDEIVSINDKENIVKRCNTCYDIRYSKFDRRDKKNIIYRDYNKC